MKIALFVKKYDDSLPIIQNVLKHFYVANPSIDFYDTIAAYQENSAVKPFYQFFNNPGYDVIVIDKDFPLYDCSASLYLVKCIANSLKEKTNNNFIVHKNHTKLLTKFNFNATHNGGFLGDTDYECIDTTITFLVKDSASSTIFAQMDIKKVFSDLDPEAWASYTLLGAYYKPAAILNILKSYSLIDKGLRILDLGSGPCFVGLELLLNLAQHNQQTKLECVDSLAEYSRIPNNIMELKKLFPLFKRKDFTFHRMGMEQYQFQGQYNLIMLIGSLLYVPRNNVAHLLSNIFEHLAPNGLLLIHENIKHKNYVKDFNVMFKKEELENYLLPYGNISYFHGANGIPLKDNLVEDKTVFRILQK